MTILILHGVDGKAGDHWERWLHDQLLAQGHTVLMPTLPHSEHPERNEWFSEVKSLLNEIILDDLVIVAHSLGVPTALDFIESSPRKIAALISVAGFSSNYGSELNEHFMSKKSIDFTKVREHLNQSFVLYGDTDPYVPQEILQDLAKQLGVIPLVFPNGGHLNTDAGYTEFPEILQIIEQLSLLYRNS